jgi:hypothetical protein
MNKKIIIKFLNIAFPIARIKHKNHFKRAIVINETPYFINNNQQLMSARLQLIRIIKNVFDCPDEITSSVLSDFLRIN